MNSSKQTHLYLLKRTKANNKNCACWQYCIRDIDIRKKIRNDVDMLWTVSQKVRETLARAWRAACDLRHLGSGLILLRWVYYRQKATFLAMRRNDSTVFQDEKVVGLQVFVKDKWSTCHFMRYQRAVLYVCAQMWPPFAVPLSRTRLCERLVCGRWMTTNWVIMSWNCNPSFHI